MAAKGRHAVSGTPRLSIFMSRTIARMSLFGIAASGDLRARLPEPFGFLLAAIDDRLARLEVSDHREHAITRAASSRN
jgi:hypothetical protein